MTQTVLITGAGIGIGRATALAFGAAGYRVIVTDVLAREGQAVADEVIAAGGEAEFHLLDVRSTERAEAVVADVVARHGALDVLVANAGIAHKVPLGQLTDEKWDFTFDIDLKGMLRVIRPAVPGMRIVPHRNWPGTFCWFGMCATPCCTGRKVSATWSGCVVPLAT